MPFTKLPQLEHGYVGCLNCGPHPTTMPVNTPLAVGFGVVSVSKDGEVIWNGDDEHVWLRRFEWRAAKDPDHDWRVKFDSPMKMNVYQRQGENLWVLVETGPGFA